MNSKQNSSRFFSECALFLLAVVFQIAVFGYLQLSRRMPGGLDGFQYFCMQYYFINNKVVSGEIPLWVPYLTHGSVTSWWYLICIAPFQNILLEIGQWVVPLLKAADFLTIFNIGMFVDEFILLVGVWLLGKRYFSSALTRLFVAASVLGSSLWMNQAWYGFHFYYMIPLVLHFFHRFLETGKWRYFLFGGNLLAFQMLGNLPYCIPVTLLVVFAYFLFYVLFQFSYIKEQLRTIRFSWQAILCVVLVILSFALAFSLTRIHTEDLISYRYGRLASGETALADFLSYGRNLTLTKWWGLVLSVSPFLDMTFFIGFLGLAMVIIGLIFNVNKNNAHLLCLIIFIILVSMATPLSTVLYYLWPGMKFYRHLSLISPIAKLFLCFWAGFGLEVLLKPQVLSRLIVRNALSLAGAVLIGVSILLFVLSLDMKLADKITHVMAESNYYKINPDLTKTYVPALPVYVAADFVVEQLRIESVFCFLIAVLLIALPFLEKKSWQERLIVVLLGVHLLNMSVYKMVELKQRSIVLPKTMSSIVQFQPISYWARRSESFFSGQPREAILWILRYNPTYWTANMFLFKDQVSHSFRTDDWLKPLDQLVRAYNAQDIDDLSVLPKGLSLYNYWDFPLQHPSAGKIAGLTEDKIQFFSKAHLIEDHKLAQVLVDKRFAGDLLFVAPNNIPSGHKTLPEPWQETDSLSKNERLHLTCTLERFDSNHIEVKVQNDTSAPAWMFYSDVWHPLWRAKVNGQDTPVYKAEMAYKAVVLNPGVNDVHLSFRSFWFSVLAHYFGWLAIIWLSAVIFMSVKICRNTLKS